MQVNLSNWGGSPSPHRQVTWGLALAPSTAGAPAKPMCMDGSDPGRKSGGGWQGCRGGGEDSLKESSKLCSACQRTSSDPCISPFIKHILSTYGREQECKQREPLPTRSSRTGSVNHHAHHGNIMSVIQRATCLGCGEAGTEKCPWGHDCELKPEDGIRIPAEGTASAKSWEGRREPAELRGLEGSRGGEAGVEGQGGKV